MMLTELIRNWYQGKRIYPENDPNSSVVFFSLGYDEQPLMAKALRLIINFWLNNWKCAISIIVAFSLNTEGLK